MNTSKHIKLLKYKQEEQFKEFEHVINLLKAEELGKTLQVFDNVNYLKSGLTSPTEEFWIDCKIEEIEYEMHFGKAGNETQSHFYPILINVMHMKDGEISSRHLPLAVRIKEI